MNFKSIISKILPSLVLMVIFSPFFAFAQTPTLPLVPCDTDCTICHFFVLIKNIYDYVAFIAIPIAIGFMAYGGILLLTAGGSEQRIATGKKAILYAIIGIFLVLASWLIITFILGNLLKPGFRAWNEFPTCS